MFDSGIKASDLIAQIKDEADIAIPISDESYISWLNALEQLLYSEIIQEQKKYTFDIRSSLMPDKENLNLWPKFDDVRISDCDVSLTVTDDGAYTFSLPQGTSYALYFETEKKAVLAAGTYTVADLCHAYTEGDDLDAPRLAIYTDTEAPVKLVSIPANAPVNTHKSFTLEADTPVTFILCVPDRGTFGGATSRTVYPTLVAGRSEYQPDFIPLTTPLGVRRCDLPASNGEARVRFEDLYAVYVGNTQLIKTTLTSGAVFPNSYYKDDNRLGLNVIEKPADVTATYIVRPVLKTTSTIKSLNVMLPVEFIDLAKAKLRGEAYKLANEYELSAMWLNDYNVLLEGFKQWLSGKQPKFGM